MLGLLWGARARGSCKAMPTRSAMRENEAEMRPPCRALGCGWDKAALPCVQARPKLRGPGMCSSKGKTAWSWHMLKQGQDCVVLACAQARPRLRGPGMCSSKAKTVWFWHALKQGQDCVVLACAQARPRLRGPGMRSCSRAAHPSPIRLRRAYMSYPSTAHRVPPCLCDALNSPAAHHTHTPSEALSISCPFQIVSLPLKANALPHLCSNEHYPHLVSHLLIIYMPL